MASSRCSGSPPPSPPSPPLPSAPAFPAVRPPPQGAPKTPPRGGHRAGGCVGATALPPRQATTPKALPHSDPSGIVRKVAHQTRVGGAGGFAAAATPAVHAAAIAAGYQWDGTAHANVGSSRPPARMAQPTADLGQLQPQRGGP